MSGNIPRPVILQGEQSDGVPDDWPSVDALAAEAVWSHTSSSEIGYSGDNDTGFLRNITNATAQISESMSPTDHWDDFTSYATGAVALGMAVLGILFNVVVIFSIIQNHQLRSHISNILVCNLAVGSLLGCVLVLVIEVPVRLMAVTAKDQFTESTCNMVGFVNSVLTTGTVWSVAALSIDKYRSIDSPLRHSLVVSTFKSVAYFFVIWIIASVLSSMPFLVGQKYIFQPAHGTCDFQYSSNPSYWYILVYLGVVFYIPAVVVCFCHWRIFAIARGQSRRMAAMVHLVTLIHVPLLNNNVANHHLSPQGRKAIYTTSIFVGTFMVCYIPHAFIAIVRIFLEVFDNQILLSVTSLFLKSAFMVNIFIYGCRNRMVRESLAKYMRRKLLERASGAQWKRGQRGTSSRRRRRDIVRMDHGVAQQRRFIHKPVLQPVRSQPNLHTVHATPVLHRAISLDVDITGDSGSNMTRQCSSGSDDTPQVTPANYRKEVLATDSLDVIEEDQPPSLTVRRQSPEHGDSESHEMDELDEPSPHTPMLSPTVSQRTLSTTSTPELISNHANGNVLTQSGMTKLIHLKESVI